MSVNAINSVSKVVYRFRKLRFWKEINYANFLIPGVKKESCILNIPTALSCRVFLSKYGLSLPPGIQWLSKEDTSLEIHMHYHKRN